MNIKLPSRAVWIAVAICIAVAFLFAMVVYRPERFSGNSEALSATNSTLTANLARERERNRALEKDLVTEHERIKALEHQIATLREEKAELGGHHAQRLEEQGNAMQRENARLRALVDQHLGGSQNFFSSIEKTPLMARIVIVVILSVAWGMWDHYKKRNLLNTIKER